LTFKVSFKTADLVPAGFKLLSAKYYDNYIFPEGISSFPAAEGQTVLAHATIQRWVYKFTPFIELQMKKRKLRVGTSWNG
jgi:hypothetical protein